MRNNEQGRSMIEMLGVLAIVGVLSVGGIAGYSKAMNKFKANKIIDQITTISTNVKTIFSGQRTYNGLDLSIAGRVGILPSETFDGSKSTLTSNDVRHAFGGKMTLGPSGLITTTDEMAYILTVEELPADACVAVLTTDFGGDATVAVGTQPVSGITQSTANSSASGEIGVPGHSQHAVPFSVVSAKNACGNATKTVYFKFK